MPDTKERNQEEKATPKTPQEVMDEISYIIYPEKELDEKEAEGEGTEQQGSAYGYLKGQYGDRSDWCQFERLYQEQLEIANGASIISVCQRQFRYHMKWEAKNIGIIFLSAI